MVEPGVKVKYSSSKKLPGKGGMDRGTKKLLSSPVWLTYEGN